MNYRDTIRHLNILSQVVGDPYKDAIKTALYVLDKQIKAEEKDKDKDYAID